MPYKKIGLTVLTAILALFGVWMFRNGTFTASEARHPRADEAAGLHGEIFVMDAHTHMINR